MSSPTDAAHIRHINAKYHDAAAESYDAKWGIDYGGTGEKQVLMKLAKALGSKPERFERSLEVGAGTGYVTLNLLRCGVIGEATATDISAGMLRRLAATADRLGLHCRTVRADAERLPFPDESFDLVLGHAVLHHLPSPATALAEFRRVLVPGGTVVFMGEPSRSGHRLATFPKRLGLLAAPVWRRAVGAPIERNGGPAANGEPEEGHALEPWVDVHTFGAGELDALASEAGLVDVRVTGEELLSSAYGWMLRSMQADSNPERVPFLWHQFAFRSYLALQWLDGRLLERRLPPGLFYNLLLSARRPAG